MYINKTQIKSNGLEIYIVEYNRHSPPRKSIQTTRDPSHRSTERGQQAAVCPTLATLPNTWLHAPKILENDKFNTTNRNTVTTLSILIIEYAIKSHKP